MERADTRVAFMRVERITDADVLLPHHVHRLNRIPSLCMTIPAWAGGVWRRADTRAALLPIEGWSRMSTFFDGIECDEGAESMMLDLGRRVW